MGSGKSRGGVDLHVIIPDSHSDTQAIAADNETVSRMLDLKV